MFLKQMTRAIFFFYFSDVILAATYIYDGYIWYAIITIIFTVVPTLVVQIFSIRWHQMDEMMTKSLWLIHSLFLGVLQRYLHVLRLGKIFKDDFDF